jgi:hypothetical protein
MVRNLQTLKCENDSSLPPGDVLRSLHQPVLTVFYGQLNQRQTYALGKFGISNNCSSSDNCATCSSGSSSQCLSCLYFYNRYLSGGKCLTCTVTTTTLFNPMNQGSCLSPTLPVGCLKLNFSGQCSTCSNPLDTLFVDDNLCCRTLDGKFVNRFSTPPSCDNCFTRCKTCFGASET